VRFEKKHLNYLHESNTKTALPLVLLITLLLVAFSGLGVVIEAGHVGILRTLGAVRPEPLQEGFHLKKPFVDQVEQMDIRLTASHAQATAASKDLQTVSTQVTTQYSMNGEIAPLTYQRINGNLGKVSATLVEPAIQECVKSVTAKFTAEELVTKREVVTPDPAESDRLLYNTLKEKGRKTRSALPTLPSQTSTFLRSSIGPIRSRSRRNSKLCRRKTKASNA
jgi:regulator of protease activity HflC (stomatin/prohibitin superfamily)